MSTLPPYARLKLCSQDPESELLTTEHVKANTPLEILLSASEHGVGRNTKPVASPPGQDWTQITLEWVSGKHCLFRALEGKAGELLTVTLTDSSSNGTYVNGVKLVKGTASALRHGDRIHVFKPKTKKAQSQLILYEFEFLETTCHSIDRAEAWRNKQDLESKKQLHLRSSPGGSKIGVMENMNSLVTQNHQGQESIVMVEQVQRQIAKLSRSNDSLRNDLEYKSAEIEKLSNELQQSQQEVSRVKAEMSEKLTKEVELSTLSKKLSQEKLTIAENRIVELSKHIQKLEVEGQSVASRYSDSMSRVKGLEEELEALQRRQSDQTAALRKAREETTEKEVVLVETLDEVTQLRTVAQVYETSRLELVAKIEELEQEQRRLVALNTDQEKSLEASYAKVKTLTAREVNTRQQLSEFEGLKEELGVREDALSRQRSLYSEVMGKLESERLLKDKAVSQLQDTENKLTKVEKDLETAGQMASLACEVKALGVSEAQSKKAAADAQERVKALSYEVDTLSRSLRSAEIAAEASREDCSSLRLRLAQASGAVESMQDSEMRRRTAWEDTVSRLQFQLVGLDQENSPTKLTNSQSSLVPLIPPPATLPISEVKSELKDTSSSTSYVVQEEEEVTDQLLEPSLKRAKVEIEVEEEEDEEEEEEGEEGVGCTQMDSPMKQTSQHGSSPYSSQTSVKRQRDNTEDEDNQTSKRCFAPAEMMQTQVAELEEEGNESDATDDAKENIAERSKALEQQEDLDKSPSSNEPGNVDQPTPLPNGGVENSYGLVDDSDDEEDETQTEFQRRKPLFRDIEQTMEAAPEQQDYLEESVTLGKKDASNRGIGGESSGVEKSLSMGNDAQIEPDPELSLDGNQY